MHDSPLWPSRVWFIERLLGAARPLNFASSKTKQEIHYDKYTKIINYKVLIYHGVWGFIYLGDIKIIFLNFASFWSIFIKMQMWKIIHTPCKDSVVKRSKICKRFFIQYIKYVNNYHCWIFLPKRPQIEMSMDID